MPRFDAGSRARHRRDQIDSRLQEIVFCSPDRWANLKIPEILDREVFDPEEIQSESPVTWEVAIVACMNLCGEEHRTYRDFFHKQLEPKDRVGLEDRRQE